MNTVDHPGGSRAGVAQSDYLAQLMSRWYGLLRAHRLILTAVLLILGALLFAASEHIVWQTSLLSFFSQHSAAIHDVRLAENRNGLADAMRLDVHFAAGHTGDLRAAVEMLAHELKQTHAFSTIWYGASESRQLRAQTILGNSAAILLSHAQLDILRHRLSSRWLDRHFHRQMEKMAGPAGQLIAAQLQYDPLDMRQLLLAGLKSLNPGTGAHFSGPLLVSGNGRHALMILAPGFRPQNVAKSEKMLAVIRAAIGRVQTKMPSLRVWMVGPYRNFVENQRLVKHDLKIISIVGTLLVAGAIAIYFRRIGAVIVCLISPMVGLGTALGIAGLLHLHIPLIVLGFDGLLCGATTDYGIQLIAAMNRMARRVGRFESNMPAMAARELLGPVSMSVCTSMTGYGALAASPAPGLRSLGLFIAGATGCIWLVTFLVLPAYIGPWICRVPKLAGATDASTPSDHPAGAGKEKLRPVENNLQPAMKNNLAVSVNTSEPVSSPSGGRESLFFRLARSVRSRRLKVLATVAFILITLWLASRACLVGYTANGRSLDGSSAALKHDQAMFAGVWGHLRQSGVITIHQRSAAGALSELRKLDQTLAILKTRHLIAGYTTPAAILPDAATVQRRLAAWRTFWNPEQINRARMLLAHGASRTGLRAGAFQAALKSWQSPMIDTSALQRLRESPATLFPGVVEMLPHDISISSTVDLNASLPPRLATQWAADVRHNLPAVSIICGEVLYLNASRHASMEARHLFPFVALLILIPLWMYFRRLEIAAIAALSLAIGFIWLLGVAQWWGGGLNLLSLVPMLFTMGVAVDYGIYAASDPALRAGSATAGTRNAATFICAATTILGTAAMLLAGHPVLHWIGLTLTAGILGGYLASYFIVGPLVRRVVNPPAAAGGKRIDDLALKAVRVVVLLVMVVLLISVLGGCCSVPPPLAYRPLKSSPPTPAAVRKFLAAFPREYNQQFFAGVNAQGHRFSMIGQIKGRFPGPLRVTCASEFGTLLCDVRVSGDTPTVLHRAAEFPESLAQYLAVDIALALRLPTADVPALPRFHISGHTLVLNIDHQTDTFAGPGGFLRVCRVNSARHNIEIQYQNYRRGTFPRKLLIWDAGHCLLLTINFDAQ